MIAIAVLLQTLEMLWLRKSWSIWPSFLNQRLFTLLLIAQVLSCTAYLINPHPLPLAVMLLGTVLIGVRFQGTFNGGADYMTVVVLIGYLLPKPFGYWFIAVQLIASYVVAGFEKLRNIKWRNGSALTELVSRSNYLVPPTMVRWIAKGNTSLFLSWSLLIFECSFFVCLFSQDLFWFYFGVAVVFHLGNFWLFGLNRFFFAWLAAYPSLYWAVTVLA
jgi:hypothetical protein